MTPMIQKKAPYFSTEAVMPGGQFQTVSLDDFKGKYLVLFFYPLDFTFVCPTEIIAFSDRVAEFKALGIKVPTRNEEGILIDRQATASEVLCAYASARGFTKSSQGNPDEARASRHVLKDYVKGKLLFVHPPQGVEPTEFNRELYENEVYISKKIKEASMQASLENENPDSKKPGIKPLEMTSVDVEFFVEKTIHAKTMGKKAESDFNRAILLPHSDPSSPESVLPPKKSHKKGKKNIKQRTDWTSMNL